MEILIVHTVDDLYKCLIDEIYARYYITHFPTHENIKDIEKECYMKLSGLPIYMDTVQLQHILDKHYKPNSLNFEDIKKIKKNYR